MNSLVPKSRTMQTGWGTWGVPCKPMQEGRNAKRDRETDGEGGRERENKTSELYREEPLGEGKPSPWAGKLRVEAGMCQAYPLTGRD